MIDRPPPFQVIDGILPARPERKPEDEAGRFAELMAQAPPRLPVLADGSPPPESAHPIPDQARVFNADGFFAAAQTEPMPAVTVAVQAPALAARAEGASDVGDPVLPHQSASLPGIGGVGRSGSAPEMARTGTQPGFAKGAIRSAGSEVPMGLAVEPQVELQFEPAPPAEAETGATHGANAPLHRAGAQSSLRVAIRDIERGLQILVAVQALRPDERERLTREISALLSRHGLVPREVRIGGRVPVDHSGRS